MEEVSKVKKCYIDILKKLNILRVCWKNRKYCFFIILLFFISFSILSIIQNVLIYFIELIIFLLIYIFLVKKILTNIEYELYDKKIKKINFYGSYWLDYKYQNLRECIKKNNIDIKKVEKILKEEYQMKKYSFIEKNPIFVVSFSILLAVISSGVINSLKINIGILSLSIIGIFTAFLINDLFVWNKDKELLYLIEIILNYEGEK